MGILTADDFEQAFSLYFKEMDRCVAMGCYWALLHVLLALPDVCAALEAPQATVRERYTEWCRRYLNPPFTLLQKGDVVRAVAVFRAALRLKPDFAVAAAPRAARVRVWQITSW